MKNSRSSGAVVALILLVVLGGCRGGGGGSGGGPSVPGTIQLLAVTFDVNEGMVVNMLVNRSGGASGVATVDYATTDGTAIGGDDYTAASGTLTWANGLSGNQTVSIPIASDGISEFIESFTLILSNASTASLGANASATVNIIDNDVGALSALGVISGLGGATVNGIRYDTDSTIVNVNGAPATAADLMLGHVALVEGDVDFGAATGVADLLEVYSTVIGPVEAIDVALKQLIVMGQTVFANADTVFDASIDPDTFAGLTVGATVAISGFPDAAGNVVATRIEPDAVTAGVQVIGTVTGIDLANSLFSIGRVTIDYGNAAIVDLPGGTLSDGLLVLLRGSLVDGILVANEIVSAIDVLAAPGERFHLHGIVTRFVSPSDFDVNGIGVGTLASTGFFNGLIGDLEVGAEITIEGVVAPGADGVIASGVEFGRLVASRTTQSYDFENFTNVSVGGLANVTISQGPEFSVDVIVASAIFGDLDVTQMGDTISLGVQSSNNTQILSADITMPQLDRVEIVDGSLANVVLEDFNQTAITIDVGGVSQLRGDGLTIGDLAATVSGVSLCSTSTTFLRSAAPTSASAASVRQDSTWRSDRPSPAR